ncbi:hypothetical protein GCM10010441_07260 [Kitasatospora paracochleata]
MAGLEKPGDKLRRDCNSTVSGPGRHDRKRPRLRTTALAHDILPIPRSGSKRHVVTDAGAGVDQVGPGGVRGRHPPPTGPDPAVPGALSPAVLAMVLVELDEMAPPRPEPMYCSAITPTPRCAVGAVLAAWTEAGRSDFLQIESFPGPPAGLSSSNGATSAAWWAVQ